MNYHPLNLPIEEGRLTDDINAPTSRRDLTRIENVAWCIRNLAINNAKHPMLKPTLEHLKRLVSLHSKSHEIEIERQWNKIQSIKLP